MPMKISRLVQRVSLSRSKLSAQFHICCSPIKHPGLPASTLSRSRLSSTLPYIPKKPVLPQRLPIYHAGTLNIVSIGTWSLLGVFAAGYLFNNVLPSLLDGTAQIAHWAEVLLFTIGTWARIGALPFVTVVHLRLPLVARQSRDAMMRYAKNLPANAALDITTMNIWGLPRITRVLASEIRFTGGKTSNFARTTTAIKAENTKRPWWMGRAREKFLIWSNENRLSRGKNSGIWEMVEWKIKQGSSLTRARGGS